MLRDVLLALFALACLGVFVGILVVEVPRPALVTVVVLVMVFAVFDFARELIRSRQ